MDTIFRTYFEALPPFLTKDDLQQLVFRDGELTDKLIQDGHLKATDLPAGGPLFWREDVWRVIIKLQAGTLYEE